MLTNKLYACAAASALTFATSGCVDLSVLPVDVKTQVNQPPKVDKLSYNLSQTTITVIGTITLNNCGSEIIKSTSGSDDDASPIDITENFTVAAITSADPSAEFEIPLDQSRSWMKQVNVAVARNPNKTLVSFNGTITDQAGPTIIAAAQAAIAIGGAVAVPALAPAAGSGIAVELNALTERFGDIGDKLKLSAAQKKQLKTLLPATPPAPQNTAQKKYNCTRQVRDALDAIAVQQATVTRAQKPDGSTAVNPNVTKAQARISALQVENGLVRTIRFNWTPTHQDFVRANTSSRRTVLLKKSIDLYGGLISNVWLTADGKKAVADATNKDPAVRSRAELDLVQLQKPLSLELWIDTWTVGRGFGEPAKDSSDATKDAPNQPLGELGSSKPGGIVFRDPALATLRTCLGECGQNLAISRAAGSSGSAQVADNSHAEGLFETTSDLSDLQIPIAQMGRYYIEKLTSKLFTSANASLTQNIDGSIANVGTQSSSAAASGFAAVTAAANAQMTAVAARNTAIGAENTAATANAQYADTVNKAIADCYVQQANITTAGGRPVGKCQ